MKTVRMSIIGFGAVGQGCCTGPSDKKDYLDDVGLDFKVIAIADSRTSVTNPEGVDLAAVIARKKSKGTVGDEKLTGLEIIDTIDHELVVETTPTNIVTGGAGLENMLMWLSTRKRPCNFKQRSSCNEIW
ncbi:MAG: hypothetical protein R2741_07525 [Methanolobus sp.]